MVRRRTRAARPNRRVTSMPSRVRRIVSRMETGRKITPPTDPPEFNPAPFWPYTLVVKHDKGETVKTDAIHASLLTSLGSDFSAAKFSFKVLSVRTWGLNKQPIKLTVYEQINGSHQICNMSDYGGAVSFSRVGYRFGLSSKIDVHTKEDATPVFAVSGTLSTTDMALTYIQLLIRVLSPPAPKDQVMGIVKSMSNGMVIV